MSTDKRALLEAVNDLIQDHAATLKVTALDEVAKLKRRYPIKLTGELAILNPLLNLMLDDPDAWEQVKRLIDTKRALLEFEPLWPAPKKVTFADRKNEYQAKLMARIRERANRAVEIENMQRPERDRLIGNARLEFMRITTNNWGKERDARIAAEKAAAGKLTKVQIDAIRDKFWQSIDDMLDAKETAVRKELLKPSHQRQRI
jgi:hypothetical protein